MASVIFKPSATYILPYFMIRSIVYTHYSTPRRPHGTDTLSPSDRTPKVPANLVNVGFIWNNTCDLCTNPLKMSKSKDRKHRQKKRGNERQIELKLAYNESKKALEKEQRVKKALER